MLAMTLFRELISGHSASCSTSEGFEMLYHVMLMSPRSHTGFTSRLFKTSSRTVGPKEVRSKRIALRSELELRCAQHDMSMTWAWHVHGMCMACAAWNRGEASKCSNHLGGWTRPSQLNSGGRAQRPLGNSWQTSFWRLASRSMKWH